MSHMKPLGMVLAEARELERTLIWGRGTFSGDSVTIGALVSWTVRLREAIVAHRAQHADDRCIEDDDRLYAALGDGVTCDRQVGDPEAMLANCKRFIAQRCQGGGPWRTYHELEVENARLLARIAELKGELP